MGLLIDWERPWSSTDSVGSKDVPYHTPKDDTSSLSTVEPFPNHEAQEKPKQLELHGKEKVVAVNTFTEKQILVT